MTCEFDLVRTGFLKDFVDQLVYRSRDSVATCFVIKVERVVLNSDKSILAVTIAAEQHRDVSDIVAGTIGAVNENKRSLAVIAVFVRDDDRALIARLIFARSICLMFARVITFVFLIRGSICLRFARVALANTIFFMFRYVVTGTCAITIPRAM